MPRATLVAIALLVTASAAFALREPVQVWEEVYVRVRPGATVQARFHFSIDPAFVVVAAALEDTTKLRPLTLRMKTETGVQIGKPVYPPPSATASVEGLPEFAAYDGVIAVSVPVTVPQKAKWSKRRLQGALEYQACTAAGCGAPSALPVAIEVELRPDGGRQAP